MDIIERLNQLQEKFREIDRDIEKLKNDIAGNKPSENFEKTLEVDSMLTDLASSFKK